MNIIGVSFILFVVYVLYGLVKSHIERKKRVKSGEICYNCKHYHRYWKSCYIRSLFSALDEDSYCSKWESRK